MSNYELFTKMYIVDNMSEVYFFDWKFVLPVMEELDKLGEKYFLIYSHYSNDKRTETPAENYLRFRLYGHPKIIEHFQKIESKLIKNLGYESDIDDFSFEKVAKNQGINLEEMMKLFEIWSNTARLKIDLIKLWLRGNGNSWKKGTHYALNILGFVQVVSIPDN